MLSRPLMFGEEPLATFAKPLRLTSFADLPVAAAPGILLSFGVAAELVEAALLLAAAGLLLLALLGAVLLLLKELLPQAASPKAARTAVASVIAAADFDPS